MPGLLGLGGHLGGPAVSALVDGQLDEECEERAWAHVAACPGCRRAVEREGWTKRQLHRVPGGEPSARLLGSLYDLDASHLHPAGSAEQVAESWAAVEHLERQGRSRRRAGIALVGAGSVSAAVLGLSTLSGASLGIGGAPSGTPTPAVTRPASPPAASVGRAPTSRPATSTRPAPVTFPSGGPSPQWSLTPQSGSTLPAAVITPR